MAWVERFVTPAGAGDHSGSSEANALTLAEAVALAGASLSFNVKAATYALTTTIISLAIAGPRRWRGYKTVAGDLDGEPTGVRVPGTDIPWWQFTDGVVTVNGAQQQLSNLAITTARVSAACSISGEQVRLDRVRIENTGTDVNSTALYAAAANWCASRCWFKAALQGNVVRVDKPGFLVGCVIRGGNIGVWFRASGMVLHCTFDDQGYQACQVEVYETIPSLVALVGCTFYSAGSSGAYFFYFQEPSSGALVADCLLANNAAYGINNNLTPFQVHRTNNDFYLNSAGKENGFGDNPSFAEQVETSNPLVNAPAHDLSLVSTAQAVRAGCPGRFEAETYRGYFDIGATQEASMTAVEIAQAVWDPARTSYNVAGSMGAAQADVQTWRGQQPAFLLNSRVDASVGAMAGNTLTAAALAADAVAEIQAGLATANQLPALVNGRMPSVVQTFDPSAQLELVNTIWGATLPGALSGNQAGALLGTRLDAAVSTRLAASAYVVPPTVTAITDSVWDEVLAEHLQTGSTGEALSDAAAGGDGGGDPALIAAAVWEEMLAGHTVAGSAGATLSAAGSAGDPWITILPGTYPAGTAGGILGALDTVPSDLGELSTDLASVQADTNDLQTRLPAALVAGRMPADLSGQQAGLTPAAIDAILDEVIEGPFTWRQILRVLFGAQAGKTNGALGPVFNIRDVGDTKNRVQAQVDDDGNRLAVILDVS